MVLFCGIMSIVIATVFTLYNFEHGLSLLWQTPLCLVGSFLSVAILFLMIFAISVLFVDIRRPAAKHQKYYRFMTQRTVELLVFFARVKIHSTGLHMVPENQRFLLVSNHISDLDPVIFMSQLHRFELGFIGKKDIYESMTFIAKAMHKLNGLPIDRENNRNAIVTINKAAELIKNDKASMAIFPEGYTSATGKLQEFRNGAFKIAKKAHCPIVVGTIKNTPQIVKNIPIRPTDVYLDILSVISSDDVDRMTTVEIGEQVHRIMEENLNK